MGVHGDKKKGIEQLEIAAKGGHYLRPFAKILLALTALRERKPEVAREQLTDLVVEFPGNLASELAKVALLLQQLSRIVGSRMLSPVNAD